MCYTPYGCRIINRKAVVNKQAAKQIRTLFQTYLSGDFLAAAAKKTDIKTFHVVISRMFQTGRKAKRCRLSLYFPIHRRN